MTNTFTRHWRLIALVLGVIIFIWVLYILRTVILPFAVGLVLAYLLMPFVSWLERSLPPKKKWRGFKRALSVWVTFLVLVILIGGFAYFIVTTVIDAWEILLESAPDILSRGIYQIQEWFQGLREQLPPQIRQEVDKSLIDAGATIGTSIRQYLIGGIAEVPRTFGTILGFAALPFFLFYIMKDSEKLKNGIYSVFSTSARDHARNVLTIIENVLGRYIRAQIMLGVIVAYFSFIGLLVLRVPFAPVLAILAGVTELIPTLGPWIGGGVATVVTLAVAPEKTIWVIVLFVVVQLVENNALVPRIQSAYLRIHPAVLIFLLVMGAYVAGFWGLLLIAPFTATIIELIKYGRRAYQSAEAGPPIGEE